MKPTIDVSNGGLGGEQEGAYKVLRAVGLLRFLRGF